MFPAGDAPHLRPQIGVFHFCIEAVGDLIGAESDFIEVTAMDLVVACGCSGITPLTQWIPWYTPRLRLR